jgi:uncharacterized protein
MAKTRKLDVISHMLHRKENLGLQAFRNRLQQSFGGRVRQVALFGSKARGESSPDADLDVLVIIEGDDRLLRRGVIDIASELSLEYDILLSPRVIDEQNWKSRQEFRLYRNIARDAVQIPVSLE